MKTQSIINNLEFQLNKQLNNITDEDLKLIQSININRLDFNGNILDVDSNDLLNFKNVEEINISNCMIDELFLENLTKLNKLKSLNFYNADFVDGVEDFFEIKSFYKLTFDNCIGMDSISFNNINELYIKNCEVNNDFHNINKLDIRFSTLDINKFLLESINELVIDEKIKNEIMLFKYEIKTIKIINNFDEIIEEINNVGA